MTDTEDTQRYSRMRLALAAVLVLLMLLLVALGVFINQVLTPVAAPGASEELPEGLEWVRSIYGYGPSPAEQFDSPTGTAIGPDGTIWGSDNQHSRVMGFAPDGELRTVIAMPPEMTEAMMRNPKGVWVTDDDEIYVCAFGSGKVLVFSTEGDLLRHWDLAQPIDVAVRGDLVAVTARDGIFLYTRDGELISSFGERGPALEQTDFAQGVLIDEDGTVLVADTHNHLVKAFTQEGELVWAGPEPSEDYEPEFAAGTLMTPLQVASGMTFDGKGRLVLSDAFGFDLVVVDPDAQGEIVARYGEQGSEDGYFTYPTGISYDPDRDWFSVSDTGNDRLQIVRLPDSTDDTLMTSIRRSLIGPIWVCAIPLILLLIAVIIAVSARRRRRSETGAATGVMEVERPTSSEYAD